MKHTEESDTVEVSLSSLILSFGGLLMQSLHTLTAIRLISLAATGDFEAHDTT